jgi:hypothetical protein
MIYLNDDKAAIDAMLLTKDKAIPAFSQLHGVPLERIGAIGDGTNDLPFLRTPGLGLVGTVANAKDEVKSAVRAMRAGYVSEKSYLDGFFDFYDVAGKRGITHIISDKDGILIWKGDCSRGNEFSSRVAKNMGVNGSPVVSVLTGSGYEQNTDFMRAYGLDERLLKNPTVARHPYLILAENGAIQLDVLTGKVLNYCKRLDRNMLKILLGPFKQSVVQEVGASVLPRFDFCWSNSPQEQTAQVYLANKLSMVTVNVPRWQANGTDFRATEGARTFRKSVMEVMQKTAEQMDLEYKVL